MSAPSYTKFAAFMAWLDNNPSNTLSYDANVILDDNSDHSSSDEEEDLRPNEPTVNRQNLPATMRMLPEQEVQLEQTDYPDQRDGPILIEFILDNLVDASRKSKAIDMEEEDKLENPTAEFLRWHHRLNHLPTNRIKQLSHLGILPKRLATRDHTPTTAAASDGMFSMSSIAIYSHSLHQQPEECHQRQPLLCTNHPISI